MTVDTADLRRRIAARLAAAGVPSPDVDARWLVDHVTTNGIADARALEPLVVRRVAREPLQRILGTSAFRHVEVVVAPGVFVPRPETEVVAGAAIDAVHRARLRTPTPTCVDLCTGSGVIALAVATEAAPVRVVATDRDAAAVAATTANAADAGVRVEVHVGDLFRPLPDDLRGDVDVLVSNPPYLPAADVDSWEPEVRDHDPRAALVGGVDGHEVVDRILDAAGTWLAPGGRVIVEIDDRRGDDAVRRARAAGLDDVRLLPDLTGRDRAVVATRGDR